MITSGQHFGAGGRAHGLDEEAIQRHAAARERVNVRRAYLRVARVTVITPPRIVGEEDDDIRFGQRSGAGGEDQGEAEEARFHGWLFGKRCLPRGRAARDGEHTVQFARIAVNSIPAEPTRSMFGVRTPDG